MTAREQKLQKALEQIRTIAAAWADHVPSGWARAVHELAGDALDWLPAPPPVVPAEAEKP